MESRTAAAETQVVRSGSQSMARATALRDAVRERFYPFAERAGFVRNKSRNPLRTVFRRTNREAVHVFEILWDKYGEPRFVINFGEAPIGGLEVSGEHIGPNEIEPYHCATLGSLTRRTGFTLRCWFQLKRPWPDALASMRRTYNPDEVVDQLIEYFPEIETWWAEKVEGPHIEFVRRAA